MCGSESGFIELMFGFSFVGIAIFSGLWRREVNERRKQSKELLGSIKRDFSEEIYIIINNLIETIKTILPEFVRGRHSVILENTILNLSEKFSEDTSSLCDCLNALSAEIDELKAKKEAIAVRTLAERIMKMKLLVDNYNIKSMQEAIRYNSEKNDLIKRLEIALRKLQELVASKSGEFKKE